MEVFKEFGIAECYVNNGGDKWNNLYVLHRRDHEIKYSCVYSMPFDKPSPFCHFCHLNAKKTRNNLVTNLNFPHNTYVLQKDSVVADNPLPVK